MYKFQEVGIDCPKDLGRGVNKLSDFVNRLSNFPAQKRTFAAIQIVKQGGLRALAAGCRRFRSHPFMRSGVYVLSTGRAFG